MPQLWAWIQRDIWRLRAPWPARHFWVVSKQPESNRLSWNNFRQPREGCYKLHGKDDWPVRQEWSNHCTESQRKHPKKSWAFLSHPWVRTWGAKGVDRARSVIFCDQLFVVSILFCQALFEQHFSGPIIGGGILLAVLNFFVQVCLRHSFLQLGLSWLLLLHFISGDKHLLTRSLNHLYHVAISKQCNNHTLLIVSKIWKLV